MIERKIVTEGDPTEPVPSFEELVDRNQARFWELQAMIVDLYSITSENSREAQKIANQFRYVVDQQDTILQEWLEAEGRSYFHSDFQTIYQRLGMNSEYLRQEPALLAEASSDVNNLTGISTGVRELLETRDHIIQQFKAAVIKAAA